MKVNVRYTNKDGVAVDYFWIDFNEAEEPSDGTSIPVGYRGLDPSTRAFYELDNGSMISTGLWVAPHKVREFRSLLQKYGMRLHRMTDAEIIKANEVKPW